MQAYTDYPIIELGDDEDKIAPIRKCEIIAFDGDKYCDVLIEGIETSFKAGYLYIEEGRCGSAKCVSIKDLEKLASSI